MAFLGWLDTLRKNGWETVRNVFHEAVAPNNRHYAIKTALAAALSFLICHSVNPNYGSWAAVSSLFVMQVYVADSWRMSIYRVIGTLIGATIGYTAVVLLPSTLLWLTVGILITAGISGMLMGLDSRFRLAGLTAVVIIGTQSASNVLFLSLDQVVETMVGIFVSLLVSTILWPISGATKLRQDLAHQYTHLTETLVTLISAFINHQSKVAPNLLANLHRSLDDDYAALRQLQEYDQVNLRRHYGDLPILINTLNTFRTYTALMEELLNSAHEDGIVLKHSDQLHSLVENINILLRWAGNSHAAPAPTTALPKLLSEDNPFYPSDLYQNSADSGLSRTKVTQILAFCYALNHLASQAETLRQQLLDWQSGTPDPSLAPDAVS